MFFDYSAVILALFSRFNLNMLLVLAYSYTIVVCYPTVQVLVVRNDLKMGKGKIAAQCRYANNA